MRKYAGVILDTAGNVSEGVSITVYLTGTTTKATLYLDKGVTQITNPVTSDANGRFNFYVANGDYDLKFTGPNINSYTITDIEIVDCLEIYNMVASGASNHNLLSLTHPDTLSASPLAGDILFANSTPKWARLAKGTDGQVLTLVNSLPSWTTITNTPGGSDTQLQYNNAGAFGGMQFATFNNVTNLLKISYNTEFHGGYTTVDGTLQIGYDTTGQARWLAFNGIHYTEICGSTQTANFTYSLPSAFAGDGTFLRHDGSGILSWAAAAAGDHNILSSTHLDTLAASVVAGDIIYGNATPKWASLAKGSAGQVLTMGAALPAWATPLWTDNTMHLHPTSNRDIYIGGFTANFTILVGQSFTYAASAIYRTNNEINKSTTAFYVEHLDNDATNYGETYTSNGIVVLVNGPMSGSTYTGNTKDMHGIISRATTKTLNWSAKGVSGVIGQAFQYGIGVASNEFGAYNPSNASSKAAILYGVMGNVFPNRGIWDSNHRFVGVVASNQGTYAASAAFWAYGTFDKGLDLTNVTINNVAIYLPNNKPITYINAAGTNVLIFGKIDTNDVAVVGCQAAGVQLGFDSPTANPINIRVGSANSKVIEVGAVDSGGTGYKMLRVLN